MLVEFHKQDQPDDVVATATNGEDAVRVCEEQQPDVLVVDYRLGRGPNGVDVARQVQRSGLRVVLFTNYIEVAVLRDAAEAGVTVVEKGNLHALRRAVLSQ